MKKDKMSIRTLLKKENIYILDCTKKEDVIKELLEFILLKDSKDINEKEFNYVYDALIKRENLMSTGIGKGVAIPHAGIENTGEIKIGVGILKNPVKWDSFDNKPVRIVIMVIFGEKHREDYLKIIGEISRILKTEKYRKAVLRLTNKEKILNIFLQQPD